MKVLLTIISLVISFSAISAFAQMDPCERSCSNECRQQIERLDYRLRQMKQTCGLDPDRPPRYEEPDFYIQAYSWGNCEDGDMIARFSRRSSCEDLKSSRSVWSVKVMADGMGTCEKTKSMNVSQACVAFRDLGNSRSVLFYYDSQCDSDLVGAVVESQDCSHVAQAVGNNRVWAVKLGGVNSRCQQIDTADFLTACKRFAR